MSREFGQCGEIVVNTGLQLAPDLTFPSSLVSANAYIQVSAIDASAGLTSLLSLTGKYAISHLELQDVIAESNTYKITIDGVVVMNDTFVSGTTQSFIGNPSTTPYDTMIVVCETSFLFEVDTNSDTSITMNYLARPIL